MAEKVMRYLAFGRSVVFLAIVTGSVDTEAAARRSGDLLDDPAEPAVIELRPGPVASRSPVNPGTESAFSGNPLWSLPLSSLTITRDRPIFSPSRRPLPAASLPSPSAVIAPAAAVSDRLSITLVGTIASGPDSIVIFTESGSQDVIRLRIGEAQNGWVLRTVQNREASFEKGSQIETIAMAKFEEHLAVPLGAPSHPIPLTPASPASSSPAFAVPQSSGRAGRR
jgi:hypothetical protein